MADDQKFSLRWHNFKSDLSAGLQESLMRGDLMDVTLAADGQLVKAHRLVLSACSPYFRQIFTQMPVNEHASFFLNDVRFALKDLIQYMYYGEVTVKKEELDAFKATAQALQIIGLMDPPPAQSPNEPSTPTRSSVEEASDDHGQTMTTPIVIQAASMATAQALEINGLMPDSDPPPAQSPNEPSTPTRSSVEEASDDHGQTMTTPIVIQAAPQATAIAQPIQQTQHTSAPEQMDSTTSANTPVVRHKRPAQRSIGSAQHVKRTKNRIDLLGDAHSGNHQQITIQISLSGEEAQPQSEPDTDDAGEVEAEHEGNNVEDDSDGELRCDENYFTETEEGAAQPASTPTTNASATTSKRYELRNRLDK